MGTEKHQMENSCKISVHIYYFHEGKTKKHHNERIDTSEKTDADKDPL